MNICIRAGTGLLAAGLCMSPASAGDCQPGWDLTIGQPGFWGPWGSTSVRAIEVFDDGLGSEIYVGGIVATAADVEVNRIARWDGENWWSLNGGMNQTVWGLTTFDDGNGEALYAIGTFTEAGGIEANNIAKWDGTSWSPLGAGVSNHYPDFPVPVASAGIVVLGHDHGTGPQLYLGGNFNVADGMTANGIARWDIGTQTYHTLGTGVGPKSVAWGQVNDLIVYDDGTGEALYVCGWFDEAGDLSAPHVARWYFETEQWSPVGAGVPGPAQAMILFDDGSGRGEELYIGGPFTEFGAVSQNYIARWNAVAQAWEQVAILSDGHTGSGGSITDFEIFDDGTGPALYVSGVFTNIGGVDAVDLAKWDGREWSAVGDGVIDGTMVATLKATVDELGPVLYVGGLFNTVAGQNANYIAAYRGCSDGGECGFADLDCSGAVDVFDLLMLLAEWGDCPTPEDDACPGDLDENGVVDVFDLLSLLASWG